MRALRSAVLVTLLLSLLAAAPAHAAMSAHGSVGQAYVLGAPKGAKLQLVRSGRVLAGGRADRFGSKIFRGLKPGGGYRVRAGSRSTRHFAVLRRGANPPAAFYRRKKLHAGLNYVTMRDGVKLAMTVRLPAGKTLADGPFPTVIEYSGYQVAAPHDLRPGTSDPLAPASSTAVGSLIAPQLGFATVSVQMRGSGCSGGAFDLFDLPTTYDGYDAVESVAAQRWVKRHRVGLVGISFSGITQLFVAGTRPPHLAAISPMSVTDDVYQGTGYPGGIFNSGFAKSWVSERMRDARPAPAGGQPYARALTRAGDRNCIANQKLRLQTQDALKMQQENPFRTPSIFAQRAPGPWLARDRVPTFLIGQFQDEQTGGHFPESLRYLSHNRRVWVSLQNGVHADSLGPSTITRWVEFLDLYVANEVPAVPPGIAALGPALYQLLAGAPASPIQPTRFTGYTSVAAAKKVFERDPRVRLLMDSGAGPAGLGSIGATWSIGAAAWPPRSARATRFYLDPNGVLGARRKAAASAGYVAAPKARPRQTLPGDGDADAWKAQPPYDWAPVRAGKGLGWVTARLTKDAIVAGPSSLDLWLKSSRRDTDLQVTLSEVRPDGRETYVQNGWLRASHRRLGPGSTAIDPWPTHLVSDARAMPKGRYVLVRVPIWPVAHAFRKGSRIRVTVQAPGGDRPRWDFATVDRGTTRNRVLLGGARPSKLVLPVLRGATAKGTPLPAPTALRGEPDRRYVRASNGG
jgi:predicted acyl esterase